MTNISPPTRQALGIGLEEFDYPYPVGFLAVENDLQSLTMAYMDVPPSSKANGSTVVLVHGKAFGGYYFLNVIEALTNAGYRVIAPDQIGWGKSSKPDVHYSFQLFAANTATLLDHLGVGNVAVLGDSTGGMTATRFTLMNPDRVTHLVLEDPLGLVDYRTGIPPQSEETLYDHEVHWTDPDVIHAYVAGYFVHPDPKVWEPLAEVLVRVTLSPDYPRRARGGAHVPDDLSAARPVRVPPHQASDVADCRRKRPRGAARPVRHAGRSCPAGRLLGALSCRYPRHTAGHTGRGARLRAHPPPRGARAVLGRLPPLPGELTGCRSGDRAPGLLSFRQAYSVRFRN
jgi:pimeloyl-ACP methyl ester carboxylesterase